MALEDTFRAGLSAIITAHGGVTVGYRGESATGLLVLQDKQTTNDEWGQGGTTGYTVRVPSDEISEPERGGQIVVDGQQVYVLGCRTSGGVRVLMCSETQPVEGV